MVIYRTVLTPKFNFEDALESNPPKTIKGIPEMDAHILKDDVCLEVGLAAEATAQRIGLDAGARAERIGFAELDAMGKVAGDICESSRDIIREVSGDAKYVAGVVERQGFANQAATASNGAEGRAVTERFGLHNAESTERNGEMNVVATKDAEKDILEAICRSSSGLSEAAREILMSQCGGFKDVLLQSAQNTALLQQAMCDDTKQILLQSAGDTASIKAQSASEFKDVLLQSAGNAAAIRADLAAGVKDVQMQLCESTDNIKSQSASQFKDLLLQAADIAKDSAVAAALNAKDAELSRTVFAKDAALAAAVNYEKLYAQGDRNTAAMQATAMENACKVEAQIAECCCEQKELARELDKERIRDELAKTREELIALRVRATLLPPLVGAAPL